MNGMFCVSEFAFDDYLSREEQTDLLRTYRAANMRRFHYMNAATLDYSHVSWFYSYNTACIGAMFDERFERSYLFVMPFVYDEKDFRNSRTTNKQINRWLREHGYNVTVSGLRTVYSNAKNYYASYPLTMDDGSLVVPRFRHIQKYVNDDGSFSYDRVKSFVPHLAYNDDCSALVVDGTNVLSDDGSTEYLRHDSYLERMV